LLKVDTRQWSRHCRFGVSRRGRGQRFIEKKIKCSRTRCSFERRDLSVTPSKGSVFFKGGGGCAQGRGRTRGTDCCLGKMKGKDYGRGGGPDSGSSRKNTPHAPGARNGRGAVLTRRGKRRRTEKNGGRKSTWRGPLRMWLSAHHPGRKKQVGGHVADSPQGGRGQKNWFEQWESPGKRAKKWKPGLKCDRPPQNIVKRNKRENLKTLRRDNSHIQSSGSVKKHRSPGRPKGENRVSDDKKIS